MNIKNTKLNKIDFFLLIIIILSLTLIFSNLGNRLISGDEGYTVLVAKTILVNEPNENFISKLLPDSFYTENNNTFVIDNRDDAHTSILGKEVYTWNPWLQEYLTAASFSLFGISEFSARLPAALFGFFVIILFYFFAKAMTNNKWITQVSTILLVTSVSFLLHVRQARWYSITIFFTLAAIFSYIYYFSNKEPKKKFPLYFIISSILLFHSNFFIFFAIFFALAIHFIFFLKDIKQKFKKAICPLILIFSFTFSWFILTNQFSKSTAAAPSILKTLINLIINYYYTFILFFPFLFLFLFLNKKIRKELFSKNYLFFFITVFASILFMSVTTHLLPQVRYLVCLIPLFCLINAALLNQVKEKSKVIAYTILILLILTNFLNIFPFLFFKSTANNLNQNLVSNYEQSKFINDSLSIKYPFLGYIHEITHDYTSSDELIINHIKNYGDNNNTFITSGTPRTFLFYTNMKLCDFNCSSVDWIIPRSYKIEEEKIKQFVDTANEKYNLSNYEAIIININDERWADAPDLINHRFKTNFDGIITIYHIKK